MRLCRCWEGQSLETHQAPGCCSGLHVCLYSEEQGYLTQVILDGHKHSLRLPCICFMVLRTKILDVSTCILFAPETSKLLGLSPSDKFNPKETLGTELINHWSASQNLTPNLNLQIARCSLLRVSGALCLSAAKSSSCAGVSAPAGAAALALREAFLLSWAEEIFSIETVDHVDHGHADSKPKYNWSPVPFFNSRWFLSALPSISLWKHIFFFFNLFSQKTIFCFETRCCEKV